MDITSESNNYSSQAVSLFFFHTHSIQRLSLKSHAVYTLPMEKWVEEIEESIAGAKAVMEGEIGSCSRICKVISNSFEDMSLLNRHRAVKKVLEKHFAGDLHALSIQTYTEKEWEDAKRNS